MAAQAPARPGARCRCGNVGRAPGLLCTRLSAHGVYTRAREADTSLSSGLPNANPALGPTLSGSQLGLMGNGLPLCPQLFLDDSKMKNFITCFKGTAAPSYPPSISLQQGPDGLCSPASPLARPKQRTGHPAHKSPAV